MRTGGGSRSGGTAKVVEGDAALIRDLMPEDYNERPEQVVLFIVSARDANCPQHIPQRFEVADVTAALAARDRRIADLESEISQLKIHMQAKQQS